MTDKLRMSALNAREAQCIKGGDGDNGGTIIPEGYGSNNPTPNDEIPKNNPDTLKGYYVTLPSDTIPQQPAPGAEMMP